MLGDRPLSSGAQGASPQDLGPQKDRPQGKAAQVEEKSGGGADSPARSLQDLREYLEELNRAYYEESAPLVSDAEYDRLMVELARLEAEEGEGGEDLSQSPSQKVGGKASAQGLSRVRLRSPMLSLTDVFSEGEVETFLQRVLKEVPGAPFVVERKIDGLSVSIRYQNGALYQALTRGDGHSFGEDVTANVRELLALPLNLEFPPGQATKDLEIRAEVYLPKERFHALNEEAEREGEKTFMDPRNAASGILRQPSPSLVRRKGLTYLAFEIRVAEGLTFTTRSETLAYLKKLGFATVPQQGPYKEISQVVEAIEAFGKDREDMPYGVDGAVVKLDLLADSARLGASAKAPKWAVAYKYPPKEKETRVLSITSQVGRTGRITPLAILDPILLAGSRVAQATLHNYTNLAALDVRVGDLVTVIKSGEIIPAIIGVNKEARPADAQAILPPTACPVCQGPVGHPKEEGVELYCLNPHCPAKIQGQLIHFASRQAMDISGLGDRTVTLLQEKAYLRDFPDIFRLRDHRQDLIDSGLIGRQKTVDKLLEAIEGAKTRPLARILTGLGIPGVSLSRIEKILDLYPRVEDLEGLSLETWQSLPTVGPILGENLYDFFQDPATQETLDQLRSLGLTALMSDKERQAHEEAEAARKEAAQAQAAASAQMTFSLFDESLAHLTEASPEEVWRQHYPEFYDFAGKIFTIVGEFSNFRQSRLVDFFKAFGGVYHPQYSGDVQILVAGNPGRVAQGEEILAKAQERGIRILTADDLPKNLILK